MMGVIGFIACLVTVVLAVWLIHDEDPFK